MSDPNNTNNEVQQGISPYADAWRRLKKNKMAMVGLWVVVIMVVLTALAGLIAPYDATYQFAWIGAQPMGFSHPDVQQKNELRVGKPAEVREALSGLGEEDDAVEDLLKAALRRLGGA